MWLWFLKCYLQTQCLQVKFMRTSWKIALIWMPKNAFEDKSALAQLITNKKHYLSQYWPRSMSPFGVTRPQWVDWLTEPLINQESRIWVILGCASRSIARAKHGCMGGWLKLCPRSLWLKHNFNGLVQDCSNSIANALELLQSCTKPLISTWYGLK